MKNPIQPIVQDDNGVIRFKQNKIVRDLLDFATPRGFDLNDIACGDYTDDDHMQLAQLIGYSVSGFGELSYVDDETFNAAATMHDDGLNEKDARIAALEAELLAVRAGIKDAVARLYGIHPDDLMG